MGKDPDRIGYKKLPHRKFSKPRSNPVGKGNGDIKNTMDSKKKSEENLLTF